MRRLALAVALTALAAHAKDQATHKGSPKDGGFQLERFVDTNDAGRYDGGQPFNGVALSKPLTAQGDFSKEEILPVVKANQGQITACYNELLAREKKEPKPQGVAQLQFEVALDGKVANASLGSGSTINDPTFAACVVEKIKTWKFAAPRGGASVKVAYPMKLRPPD
jgi:hypothetical protein